MSITRSISAAIALLVCGFVQAAEIGWEPARRADDFVDSIGVCTHWGFADTPYGTAYDGARQRLAAAGIRHVRDTFSAHVRDLWREHGIRCTALVEVSLGQLPAQLSAWREDPGMIAMVEGPNEPNLFWGLQRTTYHGDGWPKGLRAWQDDLYAAVRGEQFLNGVPVGSPTPIFESPAEAAPLRSFDVMSVHSYAGGQMPSTSMVLTGRTMRAAISLLGRNADLRPFVATESGYHTCLTGGQALAGPHPGISEAAAGKYLPRHFAEYWNAGFVRTFAYEFIDDHLKVGDPEASFGMIRYDLSPKPSYTAVANLIALLAEARWDAPARKWQRATAPERAVQVAIEGPTTVHHLALSRADGAVDLLLWQEVPSFDLKSHHDLTPPSVAVTVRLPSAALATLYRPAGGREPQRAFASSTTIAVDVPDEVVLLRIEGATPAGGALPAPSAPRALTAEAGATTATLRWRAGGDRAVAYLVSRLGRHLAAVAPIADGSASFADQDLYPGLGFPYEVRAVGPTGLLSPPATLVVRTRDERPDLVVEALTCEPPMPKPGQTVHFRAVIANLGKAPTPMSGFGVAFAVDGKWACFGGPGQNAIAPGARVTVTSGGGGSDGRGAWVAVAGAHKITATADDLHAIDDADPGNNARTETLAVAP